MDKNIFDEAITELSESYIESWKLELTAQGHFDTGALLNSFEVEIKKATGAILIEFLANDYGEILDSGITATRVPFTQGSGATKSKYITALTEWWKRKGLSEKKALGAAFATAKKAKKEGHPTRGAFSYTRNGFRTGWIERGAAAATSSESIFEKKVTSILDGVFDSILLKSNRK